MVFKRTRMVFRGRRKHIRRFVGALCIFEVSGGGLMGWWLSAKKGLFART